MKTVAWIGFLFILLATVFAGTQVISNEKYSFSSSAFPSLPITNVKQISAIQNFKFEEYQGASLLLLELELFLLLWYPNEPPATTYNLPKLIPLSDILQVKLPSSTAMQVANQTVDGRIVSFFVATFGGLYSCTNIDLTSIVTSRHENVKPCNFAPMAAVGNVTALQITCDEQQMTANGIWIGSSRGLLYFDLDTMTGTSYQPSIKGRKLASPVNQAVTALAWNQKLQVLAVGIANGIWIYQTQINQWRVEYTPGPVDSTPTSLEFVEHGSDVAIWVGTDSAINIFHLSSYIIDRIGSINEYFPSDTYGLLPYNQITTISFEPKSKDVIVGTKMGVSRYDFENKRWKYYYGDRWIVGDVVTAVSITQLQDATSIWIATNAGLSRLTFVPSYDLLKKSQLLAEAINQRHDRFGLVADNKLLKYGDLTNFQLKDSDNDGLWTSLYLGALVYQYLSTNDASVKERLLHHFGAMEKLNLISGVKGFMARSFAKSTEKDVDGPEKWLNSTAMPGWQYKRDTSSDEVSGHMFIFTLIANHFINHTSDSDLQQIGKKSKDMIISIVDYILTNDWYLIDPVTGSHTTWGFWGPTELNDNPVRYGERHVNSLEIVSWLMSAYHLSNYNVKYYHAIQTLTGQHQYDMNLLNVKLLSDWDFSDDELIYACYLTYFVTLDNVDPSIKKSVNLYQKEIFTSLQVIWNRLKRIQSPLWNFVSLVYHPSITDKKERDQRIAESIVTLYDWPISQVNWPVKNDHRTDRLTVQDDKQRPIATTSLPYDEICFHRWNTSPFEENGGDAMHEYDGTAFLLPYWFGKYHKLL